MRRYGRTPGLPPLPEPDADGNYPAVEYLDVTIARDIIRSRRRAGLSQAELARRAGIRVETLNRIEKVKVTPSVATVDKIDRALKAAEVGKAAPGRRPGKGPAGKGKRQGNRM